MSTAQERLSAIARDGATRFAATDLAHGHGAVTRRVRRDRSVRAGVTTLAGVGVVGAGTFGILHLRAADATVLPASPSPSVTGSAEPEPSSTRRPVVAPSESAAVAEIVVENGTRIEDITAAFADAFDVSEDEALEAIIKELPPQAEGDPEGWIAATTYVLTGFSLEDAALMLTAPVIDGLELANVPSDAWHDTVTIATIVGAEANPGDVEAMRGIAAVIHNRLKADMMLQIDAPLEYIVRSDERTVSDDGYAVDSEYNTFMYTGLPPTPIWSTSPEAIEAAANPADEDWLYFATDPATGSITFASTFHEHQLNLVELGLLNERDVLPGQ